MPSSNVIKEAEAEFTEQEFELDSSAQSETNPSNQNNAKTRKRIDELLEKKRLKQLLDEDEWEL